MIKYSFRMYEFSNDVENYLNKFSISYSVLSKRGGCIKIVFNISDKIIYLQRCKLFEEYLSMKQINYKKIIKL